MAELTMVESHLDLQALGWDRLLGRNDYYQSAQWLSYVELLDSPFWRYLVFGAHDRCEAGLTVHQVNPSASPFNRVDERLRLALGRPEGSPSDDLGARLTDLLLPTLSLGGRTIGHSRALVDTAEPLPLQRERLRRLIGLAEDLAVEQGLRSLCALYVDESDQLFREELTAAGFVSFPNGAASRLDVDFEDFEGYLARFASRRRRHLRKEYNRVSAEVTITTDTLDDESATVVAELSAANSRRYGWDVSTADALKPHHLSLQAIPGAVQTLMARDRAGHTIGALAFIQWRDEIYARQIGFDYDRIGDIPLYFHLGYYRLIEEALARGVRLIDYSIEKEETKASRGCVQSAKYAYLKCLDRSTHEWVEQILCGTGTGGKAETDD